MVKNNGERQWGRHVAQKYYQSVQNLNFLIFTCIIDHKLKAKS